MSGPGRLDSLEHWAARVVWLLPIYGALTFIATIRQQPDPAGDFLGWSEFVTTAWFYTSHLGASITGLALGTIGMIGLTVVLASGRRPRAALTAMALHVLGAAPVMALFGVAAFVQPSIGDAFLGGQTSASDWYDAIFGNPRTLVPAGIGLLVFSAASVVMASPLAVHPRVSRWTAMAFALTAPFIGLLGLLVSALQPAGSLLLITSGAVIAVRVRHQPDSPAAGPTSSVDISPVGSARMVER